jgi:hypothetical protein
MNERIQELALQCNAWNQVYDNKRFMVDSNFDIERFAELLIKECGVALNPPVQVRNIISRGQAYDLIKKHFGVES